MTLANQLATPREAATDDVDLMATVGKLEAAYGVSTETRWLEQAAVSALGRIEDGTDVAAELDTLDAEFQETGDSEKLIRGSAGMVALFGLSPVLEGQIEPRDLLEAVPKIIMRAAADGPVTSGSFFTRLSEATKAQLDELEETDGMVHEIKRAIPLLKPSKLRAINDLAAQVKDGCQRSTDELVAAYQPVIRSIIFRSGFYLKGGDEDDLHQEGLIGLLEAMRDHEPAKSSFTNFAELVVKRRLIDAIKVAGRRRHSPLNEAASLDAPRRSGNEFDEDYNLMDQIDDSRADIYRTVVARATLATLFVASLKLTEMELACFSLRNDGLSYEEIIAETGYPNTKAVDNALQRCRRVFAKALAEQD